MPKKYALCLSGDPRYIQTCLDSIKRNIIDINDVDVFGHFWIRTKDTPSYITLKNCTTNNYIDYMADHCLEYIDKIKDTIQFKNILCEEHPEFDIKFIPTDVQDINDITRHNIFVQSQYYSVYKANKLKKEYEESNGFKYDLVIRLRCDIFIDNQILLDDYNPDKLYDTIIPSSNEDDVYMYDQMCIGSSENIDVFSNYYFSMKETYDNNGYNGICAQELHIPFYLKSKGLVITHSTFGQTFKICRNIYRMSVDGYSSKLMVD